MTKSEALVIVRRTYSAEKSERKITELVDTIDDDFSNATMIDLILYNGRELTPDQIVDELIEREATDARKAGDGTSDNGKADLDVTTNPTQSQASLRRCEHTAPPAAAARAGAPG